MSKRKILINYGIIIVLTISLFLLAFSLMEGWTMTGEKYYEVATRAAAIAAIVATVAAAVVAGVAAAAATAVAAIVATAVAASVTPATVAGVAAITVVVLTVVTAVVAAGVDINKHNGRFVTFCYIGEFLIIVGTISAIIFLSAP